VTGGQAPRPEPGPGADYGAVAVAGGPAAIIEARGAVKSFGQTPALRGASIAAGPGEIVAVMGPSGSGKSTLLHCLAGILTPDEGEVWFDGQRLDTLRDDRRSELRRDRFGFVFQSGQLVPELTAEENVALPLLLGGTRRAAALAEARAWFGRLGLDGLGNRRSGELSGGQAQRVALARGMVTGPEVLFADEPTGSLDSVSGELVMSLMTRMAREQGTTVILVTHDARVAAYADREVIVRDGHGQLAYRGGPFSLAGRVIPLGLRLAVSGGREAITRLVILAAAVGLGVGLLLTVVSAVNAVGVQNDRYAWLDTRAPAASAAGALDGARTATSRDPLWLLFTTDEFNGQTIYRADVAATGPDSPVPPGIPRVPGPGQYYISPALAALARSAPADELADRYPGHQAGLIGEAGLPSPDSLVIVVGRSAAQMSHLPGAAEVTSLNTTPPSGCGNACQIRGGLGPTGIDLILSVVALALALPVLIFIGTATRLSAARREQRFAAMRLVGATPRQVSLIAAVESAAAAAAGVAIGFGLFFVLRIPLAAIPFTGQSFFPAELSLSLADILAVAVGVPVAASVVARLALRRVNISPLGVTRRVTPAPLRAWRVLPLLAGLALLGFVVVHGKPASPAGQVLAFVPGFVLIMIGLVTAGPWLTMAGARVMARRASRPSGLIAARRLADDPRAAFRAVSGLVLALFIFTVAAALLATNDTKRYGPVDGAAANNVLVDQFSNITEVSDGNQVAVGSAPTPPAAVLTRLRQISGIQGVVEVRADPGLQVSGIPAAVVSCAQLASVPGLGRCAAGAAAAKVPASLADTGGNLAEVIWPAAGILARRLDSLPLGSLDVATNGSQPVIEQARTVLENAYPTGTGSPPPQTLGEATGDNNGANNAYQQLADVVILTSLTVAGCTLAVSVAGGLADRKRPFSLLRLTGARLGMLRHVIALESAVPLLAVAAVAIGVGFGASAMYATTEMRLSLVAPGAAYFVLTSVGIVLALVLIMATFPLLRRITGPETARSE
jgi:ABC-type lipoprotein export system ATPase subunit